MAGRDTLQVVGDAPYADNTLDRKGSRSYVMKSFKGLVVWRASKHNIRTVLGQNFWLFAKEASFHFASMYSKNSIFGAIAIGSENIQTIELLISDAKAANNTETC